MLSRSIQSDLYKHILYVFSISIGLYSLASYILEAGLEGGKRKIQTECYQETLEECIDLRYCIITTYE